MAKRFDHMAGPLASLPPLSPGVTAVLLYGGVPHHLVRSVLERQIRRGQSQAGVTMPAPTDVLSVYAGASDMTTAQVIAASPALSGNAKSQHFLDLPLHRDSDLLTTEGRPHLQRLVEGKGSWVTWAQRAMWADTTTATLNLAGLNDVCVRQGSRLMIFFRDQALLSNLTFERCCATVVEAHVAEPDPDCTWAFSISLPSLEGVAALGQGGALCQVAVREGQYRYRSRPLIARTLLDRYIWMSHCEEDPMDDIGEAVGLSRSAVSRRLSKMPPRQLQKFREGWRKEFREFLGKGGTASNGEAGMA